MRQQNGFFTFIFVFVYLFIFCSNSNAINPGNGSQESCNAENLRNASQAVSVAEFTQEVHSKCQTNPMLFPKSPQSIGDT